LKIDNEILRKKLILRNDSSKNILKNDNFNNNPSTFSDFSKNYLFDTYNSSFPNIIPEETYKYDNMFASPVNSLNITFWNKKNITKHNFEIYQSSNIAIEKSIDTDSPQDLLEEIYLKDLINKEKEAQNMYLKSFTMLKQLIEILYANKEDDKKTIESYSNNLKEIKEKVSNFIKK